MQRTTGALSPEREVKKMSVLDTKPEIGAICDYVLRDVSAARGSAGVIYTHIDEMEYDAFVQKIPGAKESLYEEKQNAIKAFFNRLAIANELAIILTYKDADPKIHGLDDTDIRQDNKITGSAKRIYHSLRSIQYNIVANSGSVMLGRKDEEKLDALVAYFAYEAIRLSERE